MKKIITALNIVDFIKFNTGVKRFNINTEKWCFDDKMTKSQLIVNIAVGVQYLTGLKMNGVAKMSFSQIDNLSQFKVIEITSDSNLKVSLNSRLDDSKILKNEISKLLIEWLKLNQDFLVISENMNSKPKTIKKPNGKIHQTYYFVYIDNFIAKVNSKLKLFSEKMNFVEKITTNSLRKNHSLALKRIYFLELETY